MIIIAPKCFADSKQEIGLEDSNIDEDSRDAQVIDCDPVAATNVYILERLFFFHDNYNKYWKW